MDGSLTPLQFPVAAPLGPGETLTITLGEALAHLHYLMHQGALTRDLGADDVYHFIRQGNSEPTGSYPGVKNHQNSGR